MRTREDNLRLWQEKVREFWDTTDRQKAIKLIHGDWEGGPSNIGEWWESHDWKGALLRHVPLQQSWTVLEIGCGIGRLIRRMASDCLRIYGVDISEKMIAFSKEFLTDVPNAETRLGSGNNLMGFDEATMDLIYSIIVFQHIHDVNVVSNYLREVHRVLKSGGYFVLQVVKAERLTLRSLLRNVLYFRRMRTAPRANRSWDPRIPIDNFGNTYRPRQLRTLFRHAGLSIVALEEGLVHEEWLWATARKP